MVFNKGNIPWNKGKVGIYSEDYINKLRNENMKTGKYKQTELQKEKNRIWHLGRPSKLKGIKKVEYIKTICENPNCKKEIEIVPSKLRNKKHYCCRECKDRDFVGKCLTEETKTKLSQKALERYKNGMSKEDKEKARLGRINYITKTIFKGEQIYPVVGKFETTILNNLEKYFGYKILRQYKVAGYFLDGYCPALNLAIEVDEPNHNKKRIQERDKEREQNIKERINCQFFRITIPRCIYYGR